MSFLSKEISFGGKGSKGSKGSKGKNRYPEKTNINLVMDTGKSKNNFLQIALFMVFLVVLAAFVKFGVIDVLSEGFNQKSTYDQYAEELAELQQANANYDAIREEYSHYGNGYLSDEERALNDRLEVLRLIEADVMSRADVQSIALQGNNISLTIDNIRLSTVSSIVRTLEEDSMVSFVTVSTAGTGGGGETNSSSMVTATMAIYLNSVGGEE